jgi:hypothetical protein
MARFGKLVLLGAAAYLVGCGDRTGAGAEAGVRRPDNRAVRTTVDTVADTVVLKIAGGESENDTRSVVEELRIGSLDGQPEYTFASVPYIYATSDSGIYIFEGQPPQLRLYDAAGKFVRSYGRRGEGPGEYSPLLNGLAAGSKDELFAWDVGAQRVMVFAHAGQLLDSWSTLSETSVGIINTPAGISVDTSNAVLLRDNFRLSSAESALVLRPTGPGLVRRTRNGKVVDTVRAPRLDLWPVGSISSGDPVHRVTRLMPPTPYAPAYMFGWSPHGFLVTMRGDSYIMEYHRKHAPHVRIERLTGTVLLSSDEHADLTMRAEYSVQTGIARAKGLGIQPPPEKPPIPRTKPPVTSFLLARDGRVWVRLSQPGVAEPLPQDTPAAAATAPVPMVAQPGTVAPPPPPTMRWPEPDVYEVFEPDGSYVGRVRLPTGVTLRAAFGERLWGTILDDADVPYIVRMRVTPGFEGDR